MSLNKKGKITIEVTLSDTFEEFLLTKEEADAMTKKVLQDIVNAFIFNWKAAAKQSLGSSRSNYIKGIQQIDRGKLEKAVVLVGNFNNMLEDGVSPFDMKAGFEKSLKKKIKTNGGWYLTIPLRFATAGSLGENEAFSNVMPEEVTSAAQKLSASSTGADGSKSSGQQLKLSDIPQSFQGKQKRAAVGDFGEYTHKNNIYEGIQRNEKTYENSTQSSYNSFRRVSDKSSPDSWIHSGIKSFNLIDRALNTTNIEKIADNSVDEFLSKR